jgi:predicted nicotinamide N-methyase
MINVEQRWIQDGKGGSEIGYGASVYNSSFVLADYICNHVPLMNQKIIELGAGTGLVGIAALVHSCKLLVSTDGDESLLELTRLNIQRNTEGREITGSFHVSPLYWGNTDQMQEVSKHGPFDYIVCSDIVAFPYQEAYSSLVDTLVFLSSMNKDTVVLMSYQRRKGECEAKFFHRASKHFVIEEVDRSFLHKDFTSDSLDSAVSPIQIFKMVLK